MITDPWMRLVVAVAIALVVAVAITAVVALSIRLIARRQVWARSLIGRVRIPFRILLLVALLWVAFANYAPDFAGHGAVSHVFLILTIAAAAWLVCSLAIFFEDLWLARFRMDMPDNRVARRIRTQVLIIRRLTVVATVIVALGSILLTFPGAQAAGASLLASAGLVSIVAGLAAQSTLANVFAGMQLAFSDAIRVDDVVIAHKEWGRIEEITLTYVVVHIWDDRRMVLPSTYFTTTPFENWTRRNSELLGSVEFDLDWRAAPARMREELHRILETTDLWDGRVGVLQITDAVGGFVRVRVLVSAGDAGKLFDLRCLVREQLISWLHGSSPQAIPRTRVQLVEAEPEARAGKADMDTAEESALFSGDEAAEVRGGQFTGPINTIPREDL
ncbi:MAG: mechanosensitive ion channel protein MscS [Homoserinimonas sp.]|jgi:small-conductance mechanosensitive channel|nr:mechanosensitive ion channel protein MscS [Mycetocola sp.]MCU1546402.1 mechanosensitive ion channel protein MscS [Homoserinimonas sp.]